MKEDIFAKMTDDTRTLVQQMRAENVSPPSDADPVGLVRDGYRQIIPLAGAIEAVAAVEGYKVSSVTSEIPIRVYRPQAKDDRALLPAIVF